MGTEFKKVLILADYDSLDLAERIHKELSKRDMYGGLEPFDPNALYLNRFNNKEIDCNIKSSVRGRDVFLVKSFNVCAKRWDKDNQARPALEDLCYSPTEGYNELFMLNDALKHGEVHKLTNVMPHMPYQRQDRRPKRKGEFIRGSISAKLYAELLKVSGADRVITLDPHFKQIEGFYSIPVNCLESFVLYAEFLEESFKDRMDKLTIVSPDYGGVESARKYSNYFNRPMIIMDKRRSEEGKSEILNMIGEKKDVAGMTAVIMDDLIDTAGTIRLACKKLKEEGAAEVIVCCTHPVLSGDAKDKLLEEGITLVTTNSIRINNLEKYTNIKGIDTSYIIASAIDCICNGRSISTHLADYKQYRAEKGLGKKADSQA